MVALLAKLGGILLLGVVVFLILAAVGLVAIGLVWIVSLLVEQRRRPEVRGFEVKLNAGRSPSLKRKKHDRV